MRVNESMILFWGGYYSQWYKSGFSVDGVSYNCAEQFMMAMKATHFKDEETLTRIMRCKDPKMQKALGRNVKGFDVTEWEKVCREYVFIGNMAKFSQNKDLKKLLLESGDKEIVEASPYDKIWGIGLAEDDARAFDKSKWQGKNWLGEAIMRVRAELLKDERNV